MVLNHTGKLLLLRITIIICEQLLTSKLGLAKSNLSLSDESHGVKKLAVPDDSSVARNQKKVDRLLRLMQQRLKVMHDVAREKWNQRRSIEDAKREQELLAKLREQARAYGLEGDESLGFFQAQIEAGKLIQKADFQRWQGEGVKSFANVPSLNLKVRPLLDKLSTELVSALAELRSVLGRPKVEELIQSRAQIILSGDGIDHRVRHQVIAPLLKVK